MAASNSNCISYRLWHSADTGMEKEMKKLLLGALTLLFVILGTALALPPESRTQPSSAAQNDGCPAGSYNIGISKDGKPLCKLEPTGCPYGDSIPLGPECDKHAPTSPKKPKSGSVKPQPPKSGNLNTTCGAK